MAVTASASVLIQSGYSLAQTFTGLSDTNSAPTISKTLQYANGTGAGSADKVYAAQRNLAANTSEILNVGNGSLNDTLNLPITMVRIKSVVVSLLSVNDDSALGTNCNSITIAGLNGAGGFIDGTTPKRRVFNGGFDGFGVNNAAGVNTNLALNITNEDLANAAEYIIQITGASS